GEGNRQIDRLVGAAGKSAGVPRARGNEENSGENGKREISVIVTGRKQATSENLKVLYELGTAPAKINRRRQNGSFGRPRAVCVREAYHGAAQLARRRPKTGCLGSRTLARGNFLRGHHDCVWCVRGIHAGD